jgi:hypothetical protein
MIGLVWIRQCVARLRFNRTVSRHHGVLLASQEGLELQRYRFRKGATVLETEWRFAWSDVPRIVGYKIDALTTDQIRLAFEVRGEMHIVSEDMDGFKLLIDVIGERFNCEGEVWWPQLAFPAFETNWTTIWRRLGTADDSDPRSPFPNTA